MADTDSIREPELQPNKCAEHVDARMTKLRCENLSKRFNGVPAVDGVSIAFSERGITAIVGPNGAGKTTLINTLTGVLRPDSGRMWLGERQITGYGLHRIARLGMARTFQDLRLITQMSTLRNVMLSRPRQRGEGLLGALLQLGVATAEAKNRAHALGLLRLVDLEGQTEELAGEISYGQQKLLTLACCLATGAKVILLDEPVAGVHPDLRLKILDLLRKLGHDDHLVVFIEHDLGAVRQIAERVIVMDQGRIIADGPPAEVLERPDIMEAYVG